MSAIVNRLGEKMGVFLPSGLIIEAAIIFITEKLIPFPAVVDATSPAGRGWDGTGDEDVDLVPPL